MTRPTLTVVIGANGAGKSTWCREHRNELPQDFYDADSIAQELGSYDDPDDQVAARDFVDARIASHFENRETFGFESTYSGISRPKAVRDAHKLGYAVRAFFLGTHNPVINIRRVANRVAAEVGHNVETAEVIRRWRDAQESLVKTAVLLDRISILDTSGETARVVVEFSAEQSAAPSVGRPAWAARLSARVAEARRTPVEPRSLP